MRTSIACLFTFACIAACTAPRHVERAPLVPPLSLDVPRADLVREQAGRAAADLSPPVRREEASLPRYETPPTYRTVVHVVETPVYVEVPVQADAPEALAYDPYYAGYVDYYRGDYRGRRHSREPFFPINTAIGAGIGAIIGNQSRNRDRGALIGGSLGLLMDLDRWSR